VTFALSTAGVSEEVAWIRSLGVARDSSSPRVSVFVCRSSGGVVMDAVARNGPVLLYASTILDQTDRHI